MKEEGNENDAIKTSITVKSLSHCEEDSVEIPFLPNLDEGNNDQQGPSSDDIRMNFAD